MRVCGPKKAISTSEPARLFLLKVIRCNFNTCGSMVKNLPAHAGDVRERGGCDPWVRKIPWRRKWQPTPVLAWRIPWAEEPDGLPSMGLQRIGHN